MVKGNFDPNLGISYSSRKSPRSLQICVFPPGSCYDPLRAGEKNLFTFLEIKTQCGDVCCKCKSPKVQNSAVRANRKSKTMLASKPAAQAQHMLLLICHKKNNTKSLTPQRSHRKPHGSIYMHIQLNQLDISVPTHLFKVKA